MLSGRSIAVRWYEQLKWLALGLSGLCIFFIGWIRERYILNLVNFQFQVLIPRSDPDLEQYPLGLSTFIAAFFEDPRWISSIVLNLSMALFSALFVGVWFRNRGYFWLTTAIYGALSLLCAVLVGFSMVTKNYQLGYAIAQHLKNLLQLPFLLVLLIPLLRLYEKHNKEAV